MLRVMLKSKLRGALITATELRYEGSIALDQALMDAGQLLPGEQVHVLNVSNGSRLVTYAIAAPAGSGVVALKGAAARLGQVGDEVIVLSYALVNDDEARGFRAQVVALGPGNRPGEPRSAGERRVPGAGA